MVTGETALKSHCVLFRLNNWFGSVPLGREAVVESALDVHVFGQGLVVGNGQNVLANLVIVFAQLDFQVSALHHRLPAQRDGAKPVEGQLGVDAVREIS